MAGLMSTTVKVAGMGSTKLIAGVKAIQVLQDAFWTCSRVFYQAFVNKLSVVPAASICIWPISGPHSKFSASDTNRF